MQTGTDYTIGQMFMSNVFMRNGSLTEEGIDGANPEIS